MCPHRGSRVNTRRGSKTGGLPVRGTCVDVCVLVGCVCLPVFVSSLVANYTKFCFSVVYYSWDYLLDVYDFTLSTPGPFINDRTSSTTYLSASEKKEGGGDKDIKLYIYSLPPEKLHRTLCAVQKSVINTRVDARSVWRWVSYQVSTASFDWVFLQKSPRSSHAEYDINRTKTIVVFQFHFWANARGFPSKPAQLCCLTLSYSTWQHRCKSFHSKRSTILVLAVVDTDWNSKKRYGGNVPSCTGE